MKRFERNWRLYKCLVLTILASHGLCLAEAPKLQPAAAIIAANSWAPTSLGANVPSARSSHIGVVSGSNLVVWGGSTASGKTNSGGRLNLSNNFWLPTTLIGAPTARNAHTAVTMDSGKVVVWGGDDVNAPYVNTGGIYDPVADSWIATTADASAPIGRDSHTAVSTGTKMIVFGGYKSYSGVQNSGGVFDPGTNGWTRTDQTVNVPAPRENHTAVWTGSEMIVWGGDNGGTVFNDGGIYNPATNKWRKISTINAPAARTYHTAVWTGSKMIVWGGAGFGALNSGGIYDPISDTWTPTSVVNAPSRRSSHRAVWAGNRMIIYGVGGVAKDPGGIYDPQTDTWYPGGMLANSTAPNARTKHSMVWAPLINQIVIFGGNDNINGATNTGAFYKLP